MHFTMRAIGAPVHMPSTSAMRVLRAAAHTHQTRIEPFVPVKAAHRPLATPRLRPCVRSRATSGASPSWMDMPESTPLPEDIIVFPRLKEKDPYKLLGVDKEASFEEIQEARDFLYELHKYHVPSREAIDLALDSILKNSIKWRNKHGFQPIQAGRKRDLKPEKRVSAWVRLRSHFEPFVPASTLVNEGVIYLVFAIWAGWQSMVTEPTLPLGGALAYAIWKLYDKRVKRDPEGPFMGGNALWGAIATGLGIALLGGPVVWLGIRALPLAALPVDMPLGVPFAATLTLLLGLGALYIR